MQHLNLNAKKIYIVENHHEVLEAWSVYHNQNAFILDYHTDTKPAFGNFAYVEAARRRTEKEYDTEGETEQITKELIEQYLSGGKTICDCIAKLKNDEHVDFAVRSGIINKAFAFGAKGAGCGMINKNIFDDWYQRQYTNHPIIEYTPDCVSTCVKKTHDAECLIKVADAAIENDYLVQGEAYIKQYIPDFFDEYIIDIDLDYFNTEKSLYPDDPSLFHRLIKHSTIVTIARESSCVESKKLEGEDINAEKILKRIMFHINEATKNGS